MRVALVAPVFPQLSETFIVSKAIGLLDRGIDVHVVCANSDAGRWATFGDNHPVQRLRGRVHVTAPALHPRTAVASVRHRAQVLARTPRPTVASYLSDDAFGVGRRVRELATDAELLALDPDVVHFEFGTLAPGRMRLGVRSGKAVTVSFRGFDLNYVGLDQPDHYREVWERADGIHVLGADLWRRAVQRGAAPDRDHSVITPAIDTTSVVVGAVRPGRLGTADQPLRLVSVGRLHWKKGYDHALEAVAALRARGLHVSYRIMGDGDLYEAVMFWRHQLGLDDVVEVLGAVAPADVADHYRWADILLHAATSEGFCNVVVEAQAHGLPVVCSDADGLAENIDDGVTGFVVPRRDPAAMADRIEQVAVDPAWRSAANRVGPARVAERFRIDEHLDAWERFYLTAMESAARR